MVVADVLHSALRYSDGIRVARILIDLFATKVRNFGGRAHDKGTRKKSDMSAGSMTFRVPEVCGSR